MPIQLRFTLTFQDYVDAQRLHAKRWWWPRMNFVLGYTLVPLIGVFCLLISYLMITTRSWSVFAFEFPVGLFLLCYPLFVRLRWKRCYTRTRSEDGDCTAEFDDSMIRTAAANTRSEIHWQAVRSFSENQKVFLLYLAPAKFIAIPKRICSQEIAGELRSLFKQEIGVVHR